MMKDSERFRDSDGWGYGVFEYDPASDTFRLGNLTDEPPQGNDAKCGFACHSAGEDERLRFHRLRAQVKRYEQTTYVSYRKGATSRWDALAMNV